MASCSIPITVAPIPPRQVRTIVQPQGHHQQMQRARPRTLKEDLRPPIIIYLQIRIICQLTIKRRITGQMQRRRVTESSGIGRMRNCTNSSSSREWTNRRLQKSTRCNPLTTTPRRTTRTIRSRRCISKRRVNRQRKRRQRLKKTRTSHTAAASTATKGTS